MTSRDLVLPALFGDALALGAHWIYDDAEIAEAFPDGIGHYAAPHSDYHPGKQAGDFTHYGDQTLVLLESLDRHRGFDPAAWRKDWLAFWRGKPNSYLDGATRRTLENSAAGLDRPSESHDLGGASRVAALFALPFASDEEAVTAARAQTTLTHGDPRWPRWRNSSRWRPAGCWRAPPSPKLLKVPPRRACRISPPPVRLPKVPMRTSSISA